MPFDSPQADAVPTRRSSRLRAASFATPAVGEQAAEPVFVTAPGSRRAARLAAAGVAAAVIPAVETAPAAEPVGSVAEPVVPAVDAFEQASIAFRSVAAEGAASAPSADDANRDDSNRDDEADEPVAEHVVRRRPQARRFIALGATIGVMSLAGLLAVSMTLPAEALAAVGSNGAVGMSLVAASADADGSDGQIQAFVTSSDVQNEALARTDDFTTVSLVDVASEQGIKFSDSVFTNDPDAAIQWPFMVGVSMSSGYGPRWGTMHEGIDFTPGEGAPIQAIADGTVRIATEQGGGYGVTVYIDHVIDGKLITSHYAHMQYGSLQVQAGDTVKVGDIVGHTGNTGHSFGAHLHFELIVNGKTIDPLPWLNANAGRHSLD